MGLRNLPTESAEPLGALISCHRGHVSSRALTTADVPVSAMLLAFDKGESVSEEEYFGDTLYYVVEGSARIVLPEKRVPLRVGEVFMVPAHVVHAVEGDEAFKLLQLCV